MDKIVEQLGPTLLCHRDGAVVAAPTAEVLKVRCTEHTMTQRFRTVARPTALQGCKFLAFYFSASWCGPCRAFTPEVVFVSADRDERSFDAYYAHHPWLSLPFDADARTSLPSTFSVWGIPKVSVIDLSDGHLVMGDAAGTISASPSLAGIFRSDMRDEGSWSCEIQ